MVSEVLRSSLNGWYVFINGTTKQKIIAAVLGCCITNFTVFSIDEFTGRAQKRRDRERQAQEKMDAKMQEMVDGMFQDLTKEAAAKFDEIVRKNEEEYQKNFEEFKKEFEKRNDIHFYNIDDEDQED